MDAGKGDITRVITCKKQINHFIHMSQRVFSIRQLLTELPVIIIERLKVLVHVRHCSRQPQVESPQNADILVILVLDEFDDYLLLGLYLEHLHDEANERCGLAVASESAA